MNQPPRRTPRRAGRRRAAPPGVGTRPDPAGQAFAAQARRQSRLVARHPAEADDQAFIDSVSVDPNA